MWKCFLSYLGKEKTLTTHTVTGMLSESSGGAKLILSSTLCTKNMQPTALVTVVRPPKGRVGDRVCLKMNQHCMQMK